MTEQTEAPPAIEETPTDTAEAPKKPKRKGGRRKRFALFDDGGGNFRIYEIARKDQGLPPGALLPIPGIPGFDETEKAQRFITNSGDQLNGKQLIVLKACAICAVEVQTKVAVQPRWKRGKQVDAPPEIEGS